MASDDPNSFTAKQVREATGLSYRQLNDWESRGAFESDAERGAKWRRFTPRQIFALMVCAELRSHFGFPVERLRSVRKFMLQDGADHYAYALETMATLHVAVWLVTDGEDTFIMDHEFEFMDLVNHGFLSGDAPRAYAWLKINPLVNKMLACLNEPVQIKTGGDAYDSLCELMRSSALRSVEELQIMQAVKSGNFDSVEVVLKDGRIQTIHRKREQRDVEPGEVENLIRSHAYQTVTVTQQGGRMVTVRQDVTEKPLRPSSAAKRAQ